MTVIVSTSAYEFAHGRKPRGAGQWAFIIDGNVSVPFWSVPRTPYSEAKAQAVEYAKRKGATRVEVGT